MSQLLHNFRAGTALCSEVGERIRAEREALGKAQAAAARELGVTPSYLSKVERGDKAPTADILDGVCSWRETSLEYLLFGEETPEPWEVNDDETSYNRRLAWQMPLRYRAAASSSRQVVWEPFDPPEVIEIPREIEWAEVETGSMAPVVLPKQKVGFLPSTPPVSGDLALVWLRTEAGQAAVEPVLKRYWKREGGEVMLESIGRGDPREPEMPEADMIVHERGDIARACRVILIDLRRER